MMPADGHTSPTGAETTSRTVVGMFQDRAQAEDAIRCLKQAGFASEQIGVVTGTEAADVAGILVTVNAGDRTPEALATLETCGADLGPSRKQLP